MEESKDEGRERERKKKTGVKERRGTRENEECENLETGG